MNKTTWTVCINYVNVAGHEKASFGTVQAHTFSGAIKKGLREFRSSPGANPDDVRTASVTVEPVE